MTFSSWIVLLTGTDRGNFCGLWIETFFFSYLGITCIWLMSRSQRKEKFTEMFHENPMMGTKLSAPQRDQQWQLCSPTSVDTVNFPAVPRRPVWPCRQQLQSADSPLQSFHEPLHFCHPRKMQAQMEAMWASGRTSKLTPLNLTAARRKIKIIRNGYGFNYLESIFTCQGNRWN